MEEVFAKPLTCSSKLWKNMPTGFFHFMEDKLIDDPNYFFRETAFLEVFLAFDASAGESTDEDDPESLD